MNVWTWLKFVTFLWLLRKGFKLARWLMVVAAAIVVWPVTVVAGTGYAAAWTLIMTAAWLIALEASEPGFLADVFLFSLLSSLLTMSLSTRADAR